jgi:ubiquinone/menaquinone biosynthesis C-methylase UbiE
VSGRPSGGHRVVAALYDRATAAAERGWLGDQRRALLSTAAGRTLEIGAGTGANLAHLPAAVTTLVLAEPDPAMRRRLERRLAGAPRSGARVDASRAERLDLADAGVDTVVATLVLCSVEDPVAALAEVRRVLRPGGRLLLLEHVRAAGARGRWQERLSPLWRRVAAGCHPDRDTLAAVRAAGFATDDLRLVRGGPGRSLLTPWIVGGATAPGGPPSGA